MHGNIEVEQQKRRDNLCLVITPFHGKQIIDIVRQEGLDASNSVFVTSQYVDAASLLANFPGAIQLELNLSPISFEELPRNPIKTIRKVRGVAHSYLPLISSIEQYLGDMINLYFFTEKDLFTQYLFFQLKKKGINVRYISADEGVGHYREIPRFERFRQLIYRILSPLLFGFPYRYFTALGGAKEIDVMYARMPEFLSYRNLSGVIYRKLEAGDQVDENEIRQAGKVLLLTCEVPEKINQLRKLVSIVKGAKYDVEIKPHPREDISGYAEIEGKIIDKSVSSENLPYNDYAYIIHFYSSALIDIIQRGYPLDRIICIQLRKVNVHLRFYDDIINLKAVEDLKSILNRQS